MKRKLGDLHGALADLNSADDLEPNNNFTLRYVYLDLLSYIYRKLGCVYQMLFAFCDYIQVCEFGKVYRFLKDLEDLVYMCDRRLSKNGVLWVCSSECVER